MTGLQTTLRDSIRRLQLDRFDLIVLAFIVGILAVTGIVIAAGEHVGVYVVEDGYGPTGIVGGSSTVRIQFSEAMATRSVIDHFRIAPDVPGDFSWFGQSTLLFTPHQVLQAGQTYTVTITAGARSAQRKTALQTDFSWSFSVQLPRVVFLAPSDTLVRNLYRTDLQTGAVEQLTTSEYGIEDFAVSPNGGEIAYSQADPDGTINLWLLDLADQRARPLTNCIEARCYAPSWKPDGTQIAYQREDHNRGTGLTARSSRAWVVDLATLQTQLLFADAQILGEHPSWSPDGQAIAIFDPALPGIRIHNFATGSDTVIDTIQSATGWWSPNGQKLVYPVLARGAAGTQFYTHLEMAALDSDLLTRISTLDAAPVEDGEAVWSPNGQRLAITRIYLDERYTPGKQIYLLDLETGQAEALVVDADYFHAALHWDAAGQRLVFQRYPLHQPDAVPEVWTYDLHTGQLQQRATNAMMPQWIP